MTRQNGFTLIEIMIALLIGLIIVASAITIYITSIRGSTDIARSARLNHDMDSALALMVNDIRRAGYWGGAMVGSDSRDNPFTVSGTTDIQLPSASCVLYTYDSDADGVVDANEYYGFKLNTGNIQMRLSGNTTADCNQGEWGTLNISESNEQIEITGLTITESYKCLRKRQSVADATVDNSCADADDDDDTYLVIGDRAIETREISIVLAGRVSKDQAVTKTLADRVKIRNDRIFTQT